MIHLRQTARISGIILLLLLGLGGLSFLMLPNLIETLILPHLAEQAGFSPLKCRIKHLGLNQTEAGPLTLGCGSNPAVRIEQLKLLYDPASLRKGNLKKVILSGVNIKTVFSKGTLSFPGLEGVFEKTTENGIDKDPASTSRLPIPPFSELEIKKSTLYTKAAGKEFKIPFSLLLKKSVAQKAEGTHLKGTLAIQPCNTPITLKFSANLGNNESIHFDLQAPKIDLLNFADIFDLVPGLSLKGLLALKAEADLNFDQQQNWKARLETTTDNTSWQLKEDDLTISGKAPTTITLTANGQKESMTAILQFSDATLQVPEYDLRISGISGTLPWCEPADKQKTELKGKFNCRKIFLEEFNLGRFTASLQQQQEKILIKGRYDCALVNGLKVITEGQCEFDQNGTLQAKTTFKLPAYKPKTPIALGKFSSAADGYEINGTLSAKGKLTYDTRGVSGSAVAIIKDARFSNPEKNLLCTGINCRLRLPELPSLRSAPDQRLVFDNLSAGNIICPGGCLAFQIESDETLLLEKSRISWCGGNIETQALRISPNVDHYQATLYCDRLQLAKLLEQLGQVEALGQGTVNGRIPIIWKEGKITIDNGFLYSTPGTGGSLKISGGQTLTAGLPIDSPQFAQLDLAREALKDYQYKWAKMCLNSEAEELILNLKFDGKPNLSLPFVYKAELGGFARVTAGSPGSHFQGISLDINLRLPLNRILQYKELSTIIE